MNPPAARSYQGKQVRSFSKKNAMPFAGNCSGLATAVFLLLATFVAVRNDLPESSRTHRRTEKNVTKNIELATTFRSNSR